MMTAFDFRPIRRWGLRSKRRLFSPACAEQVRQARRAEVNAMGPIVVSSVPLPLDRQRLIDCVLASQGIVA